MPAHGRARRSTVKIAALVAGFAAMASPCALPRLARAQLSDIEREWRTLQQAQSAHERGREAITRGNRAVADAELGAAADLYRQLIDQNPLRRDLFAPLADTLIRRNNAAAAYALLVGQVRGGNKEPAVQLQLVRALLAMHRHRLAFEEAQKMAQAEPKNQLWQALLGETAGEAGEATLAIGVIAQVLANPPNKSALSDAGIDLMRLRLLRVRLLLSQKRTAEAAAALSELGKAQTPEALLLLGELQLDGGHLDEAASVLRRCLATPGIAPPIRSRATVLLSQALQRGGHNKEALDALRQAGDDPQALLALSQIYLNEQPPNPAAALMVVERAVQFDVHDQRICLEHASLLEQTRRTQTALTELARCVALQPSSDGEAASDTLTLRADVELRLGKLEDGIKDLRSVLSGLGGAELQTPAAKKLTARLAQGLLRRGIEQLQAPSQGTAQENHGLADLEEAHKLQPSTATAQGLALGHLAAGKAQAAVALLLPLCQGENGVPAAAANDARLLGACGRALREIDQPEQALAFLQRAEAALQNSPNPTLRAAMRQEQAAALVALSRPLDAIKLIEGNDAAALRAKAQAFLSAVRAFYTTPMPHAVPSPVLTSGPHARGTFPPLRTAMDVPQPPQLKGLPPGAKLARGPFPPLRLAGNQVDAMSGGGMASQGLTEEKQVLTYAQAALRGGTLSVSERGEAMLYQVVALYHAGQYPLAIKLLGEIATQIDLATLDGLLGPGGFADFKARVVLRLGDFYQGTGLATQAMPLLKPQAASALKNTLAVAYTDKAIEMMERSQPDRAYVLLRNAWTQAHGGPAENQARANYNLAVMLLHRGKLEEAKNALLKIDAQLVPEVWIGLGSYRDLLGDGKGALENYRKYLQAAVPGDPQLTRVQQWVDVLERVHEVAP